MSRFSTSLLTASLVALLAVPALADSGSVGSGMTGMSMTGGASASHTCSAGQKWVNGYKKKGGTQVKGYCRGGKGASAKTTTSGK